ncbi:hypothetical protein PCA31118_03939 [Pandoraea captiosa]|uniref:Uncharacterized protein n=1 Tax=Pandoraea captiosa TaxID=2508302 RepID=A0A5E5ADD5_9BURK|nr:hypothetical protein [Pandoraea captiosa]VVE71661.1 hypothetical protein PCA31118_03939 [Pandoraea captiosa]
MQNQKAAKVIVQCAKVGLASGLFGAMLTVTFFVGGSSITSIDVGTAGILRAALLAGATGVGAYLFILQRRLAGEGDTTSRRVISARRVPRKAVTCLVALLMLSTLCVVLDRATKRRLQTYLASTTASSSETEVLRAMGIGHSDQLPGMYLWQGDEDSVGRRLDEIRRQEAQLFEQSIGFAIPFGTTAVLKSCARNLYERRLASLDVMVRLAGNRYGPDSLIESYMDARRVLHDQWAKCYKIANNLSAD